MEFAAILGYNYWDNNISSIDSNSNSNSNSNSPNIFKPSSRSLSPYRGSVKLSSWIPHARALSLGPNKLTLLEPSLSCISSITPDKLKSKAIYIIRARIIATTL